MKLSVNWRMWEVSESKQSSECKSGTRTKENNVVAVEKNQGCKNRFEAVSVLRLVSGSLISVAGVCLTMRWLLAL